MHHNEENIFLRLSYALREFKAENQTTVILGAGCSLSSTHKDISTMGIMRECLIEHGVTNAEDFHWEELYQKFINVVWEGKAKEEQKRLLNKKLGGIEPTEGHKCLRLLVENGFVKNVITTNFDMLLEKAFNGLSYNKRTGSDEYVKVGRDPKFNLLKVHGDLEEGDFRFAPNELMRLPKALQDDIFEKTSGLLVFIGYRGQDIGLMNSLSRLDNFAIYWIDINELDKLDAYATKQIFTFMAKRRSESNFLHGKGFGDFSEILKKLSDFLLSPPYKSVIKSKENGLNKEWLNTSIVELLSIYGRIYELFLDVLKISELAQETLAWKVEYPSYSKNYNELLSSYLHFFNSKRLPANLLHIPNNEIDALVLGISIEVCVRTTGNCIDPKLFISKIREELKQRERGKELALNPLWSAVENVVSASHEHEAPLRLGMANMLSLESHDFPLDEFKELMGVVGFLSLLIPSSNINPPRIDTRYKVRRFLRGKYKNAKITSDKINIELGKVRPEDLEDLSSFYLDKIPNISKKTERDDLDKRRYAFFETKWLAVRLEIDDSTELHEENVDKSYFSLLLSKSKESTFAFLRLGYVFNSSLEKHIDLQLDKDLTKFINSSKIAIFITGPSGSGKTRALQNFALKNQSLNEIITIIVSPKNSTIDRGGIGLFVDFINPNEIEAGLRNLDASIEARGKKLVLILDGLNEINEDIESQKNHYSDLSNLVDKLSSYKCKNIKIIVSCRGSAYQQYRNLSSINLNNLHFFGNNKNLDQSSMEADASYKIATLSELDKSKLISLYLTKDVANALKFNSGERARGANQVLPKHSTPFLIALVGECLNQIKGKQLINSIYNVYDNFSNIMLNRLTRDEVHIAKKVIYTYFDLMLKGGDSNIGVTRFKIFDNLPYQLHARFAAVMDRMVDLNIFIKDYTDSERVKFQHDKIEEFFLREYIEEYEYKGDGFLKRVVDLISENVIYQSGILQYLIRLVRKRKLKLLKEISINYSFSYNTLLPQMIVESLSQSQSLKQDLDYILSIDDPGTSNRMINILISGLDNSLQNFSTASYDLARVISVLLSIKDDGIVLNEHRAYLFFFQSKIFYFTNDYKKAQTYANKAANCVGSSSDLLRSKINVHCSVIFMELGFSKKSIELLSREFKIHQNKDNWEGQVEVGIELGRAFNHSGKNDEPLETYDKLLNGPYPIDDSYVLARIYEQKANVLNRIMYLKLRYGTIDRSHLSDKVINEVHELFKQAVDLYESSMSLLLKENSIFAYSGVVPEKIKTYISYSYSINPVGLEECAHLIAEMDYLFQSISTPFEGDYLISKAYYFEYLGEFQKAESIIDEAIKKTTSMRIKNKEAKCYRYKSYLIYRGLLKGEYSSNIDEMVSQGIGCLTRAVDYYKKYTLPGNTIQEESLRLMKDFKRISKA